jgi:hypothetical protein
VTTATGSAPSVLAGAAGLVADAIESALAAGLESLRSPDANAGADVPPPAGPSPRTAPREPGAPRQVPRGVGAPPAPETLGAAARSRAGTAADLAASVAARIANGTLERLDLNAIIDRVDVGRVIAKVDIEAVLSRVDLDALLGKVDLDRLVERLDVGALAKEAMDGIDVGEVIRESTMSIGGESVEAARDRAMWADGLVARVVDRALGRGGA